MSAQLTGQPPRAALTSTEAYELMLKGRVLMRRRGRAIIESRECLERAVSLDAANAEALGLLAECYRLHAMYGLAPPTEMMPLARATAERALAIDPDQQQAQSSLANMAATYDWDRPKAVRIYDRLLARHPACVPALCERAIWLSMVPSPEIEAERGFACLRIALTVDPLNAWVVAMQGIALLLTGKLDDALVTARHAVDLDGGNFVARWTMVMVLAMSQRHDEAVSAATVALPMSGRHPWLLAELAGMHAARSDTAAAEAIHLELQQRADLGHISWAERAAVAASAGHIEDARLWVQKAVDAHDMYVMLWKIAAWAPSRADAECNRILRSSGF